MLEVKLVKVYGGVPYDLCSLEYVFLKYNGLHHLPAVDLVTNFAEAISMSLLQNSVQGCNSYGENTEVSRGHSNPTPGQAPDTVKGRTLRREICYQGTSESRTSFTCTYREPEWGSSVQASVSA